MKINLLLLILLGLQLYLKAQVSYKISPLSEQQQYNGYVIRLFITPGHGYGYDILLGNRLMAHQSVHPFSLSPRGLSNKEDAFKVAHWQVDQFNAMFATDHEKKKNIALKKVPFSLLAPGKQGQPIINQHLSPQVARSLNMEPNNSSLSPKN